MEAVRTSETSVNFNVTKRRYIPEDKESKYELGSVRPEISHNLRRSATFGVGHNTKRHRT
jgi:hypothetical protein